MLEYSLIFIFGMMVLALSDVVIYTYINNINIKSFRKIFLIPLFKEKKFPLKYVIIMLSGGVMAVLCRIKLENSGHMLVVILFFGLLMAVSVIDIYKMEIPNALWIAVLALGVISIFILKDISIWDRIIGIFAASVPLFIIAVIVPGGFGGGDIKLMAAAGLLMGWKLVLISTLTGILIGGIYGIIVLITRKKSGKDHFAFGPCLSLGMIVCCFYGNRLIEIMFNLLDFSRYIG